MFTRDIYNLVNPHMHVMYANDMIQAARDSMSHPDNRNPKITDTVQAANNPDASKDLKKSVAATIEKTQYDINNLKDDVAKTMALSDLDADFIVEAQTQNIVNEDKLKNAIDNATQNQVSLDQIYTNVTGDAPDWTAAGIKKFQERLIYTLRIVRSFTGGNAGLDALLSGKLDTYLMKLSESNTFKPIEIQNPELLSPLVKNILGGVATVAVAGLTSGIVTTGYESRRVQSDEYMKVLEKDKTFLSRIGGGLTYIKEVFMGRKLSLTFGANTDGKQEGNVEAYYEAIKKDSVQIMELTPETIQNFSPEAANLLKSAKIDLSKPEDMQKLKKAMIEEYIVREGYKREGTDWKFQLSFFFTGANRDSINIKTLGTKDSDYNKIEKEMITGKVNTIQSNSDKSSSEQLVEGVRTIREKQDNYAMASRLYNVVGHSDPSTFRPLLDALAKQDGPGVIIALDTLKSTKYKSLAKDLQKDISNMDQWTTYMYGKRDSRTKEQLSQSFIDSKIRTPDLLKAEDRLASNLGITHKSDETTFQVDPIGFHTAVQASSVPDFAGQAMTISVFATPSVLESGKKKAGVHRIDTIDGSIGMSNQYVTIPSGEYRNQLIDGTLNSTSDKHGIYNQVEMLNRFLGTNKQKYITVDQYVKYLKTGNISEFSFPGLKESKATKVFEGRAMIAGNVCMNRMHGIVYPSFSIENIAQPQQVIEVKDGYSTPLNVEYVDTSLGAIGLNPIAIGIKQLHKNNKSNKSGGNDSGSTPGDNGGDKIPDTTSTPQTGGSETIPVKDIPVPSVTNTTSGAVNTTNNAGVVTGSRG